MSKATDATTTKATTTDATTTGPAAVNVNDFPREVTDLLNKLAAGFSRMGSRDPGWVNAAAAAAMGTLNRRQLAVFHERSADYLRRNVPALAAYALAAADAAAR